MAERLWYSSIMTKGSNISAEGVSGRDPLNVYRKFALRACKDFYYPEEVYRRVKKAKSEAEIEQIMHDARNKYLKD